MDLQTHKEMKGQNPPAVILSLLLISAALWGFTEQIEVTGLFSKDCVLPCPFPRGSGEVIHWSKENKKVHTYYQQKDHLEEQDPHYRGRTHLFHEKISGGNASLKLSNLSMTDEGSYTCYVGTAQYRTEVKVLLHVLAPSSYALEYQKANTERRLKCFAFLTYPAPNISWEQGNVSIQETDREETRNGDLYSIRSDKDIVNTTDTYWCHIDFHHGVWTAEWRMMQDHLQEVEGGHTIIPCEHGSDTASPDGFSVVWTLHRNAVTSVLASFNGTAHSHQPRVQIDKTDFSLRLDHLTADDSGEYLCNISTPHGTKLIVSTLHVENSGNTWRIGPVLAAVVIVVILTTVALCCLKKKWKRGVCVNKKGWHSPWGPGARVDPNTKQTRRALLDNRHPASQPTTNIKAEQKEGEKSHEHLNIWEENCSLHTETGDEKKKEFLHLELH
ncbi:HERV-H LTR-associating protein 2 isoform X1 [Catharus ustulatus]|uniref:HERV-H LTR-associating protein 2 isoform X1 n=1 Tax=Catharus ustulatus TaxID=91951 RepID=UPI00140E77AA|nr:HERV-H LTR-associating protein 2 isoform X1 [Catharus ustulatus]